MSQSNTAPETTTQEVAKVPPPSESAPRPKQRRGFAVMDRRKVSEIASKGGRAAHAAGTAHQFSSEEAREAGRKGGYATHAKRKASKSQPPPPKLDDPKGDA
jgi:general stress protein YciG